ncbi:MAG TPA: CmcI family methyltransferase [Candidatus Hydrogenedentes bacterium]|nr:CmcI family methyltransferase [Candidatus Hydrogenedentota bacterium]HPG68580.1 CmcI family methyltransferase [Candidatus Hydrogenedentota bacterium]
MTERLQLYRCARCDRRLAVLRGGEGDLVCCGEAMTLYQETGAEALERKRTMPAPPAVYACAACGAMVVALHRGQGEPICCSMPMRLCVDEATPTAEAPPQAPPMELNLSMPVKTVMQFMQWRQPTTTYFGVNTQKCPLDLWVYQEILFELKPDVIVELGNAYGGSALVMAHWLDHMGRGRIIGVDIVPDAIASIVRAHPRITLIGGDACASFEQVAALIGAGETVLVIEDTSHTYENTLNVLRTYHPLVTLGSYFIVEDSNCRHGVDIGPSPGPYEAIQQFLAENDSFESDRSRESFFITWNPRGYLKRIR